MHGVIIIHNVHFQKKIFSPGLLSASFSYQLPVLPRRMLQMQELTTNPVQVEPKEDTSSHSQSKSIRNPVPEDTFTHSHLSWSSINLLLCTYTSCSQ